jgi:hypothetical protein
MILRAFCALVGDSFYAEDPASITKADAPRAAERR